MELVPIKEWNPMLTHRVHAVVTPSRRGMACQHVSLSSLTSLRQALRFPCGSIGRFFFDADRISMSRRLSHFA